MKKLLFVAILSLAVLLCVTSCNTPSNEPLDATQSETNGNKNPSSIITEAPATSSVPETKTEPEEENPWPEDTSKFSFFQKFDAPTGKPREIVMDYMMKMAEIKWKPAEDFTICWEGTPSFDPNMSLMFFYNKTYRGTTYGNTHCSLELFTHFLDENNVLKMDNYSYEKIVGNNCSTTMTLAYQQIIDLPISVLKPISSRIGLLKLAGDLKIPEGLGDNWYSNEVFSTNGRDAVYQAYTTLDSGDILYKSIPGTGHTRMVRKVEVSKSAAGTIMPTRSFVYCVESTNAWEDSTQTSLWFIDRKYSFSDLFDTSFMPVTLEIFHEDNPSYKDAYIAYDGTPKADNILKGMIPGVISSNFPLNYVMLTVKDTNGNVVLRELKAGMTTNYTYDLRKTYLKTSTLANGDYTLTIRAGIARGGADVCTVDFSVNK